MPCEISSTKLKQRRRRRGAIESLDFENALAREVEGKRSRGEVSCAECRRLKIKCDKQIPCQSCRRRGCTSLCPNGSLSTGQGTRFVVAATEHLHDKIERLTNRIHQLEDALSKTQSQCSEYPHPLLQQEEKEVSPEVELEHDSDEDVVLEAPFDMHGTLMMSTHGISRFFGATGGSESLMIAVGETESYRSATPESSRNSMSPTSTTSGMNDMRYFAQNFPLPGVSYLTMESILDQLPTWDRAVTLIDAYFGFFNLIFHGVDKEQTTEILSVIYHKGALLDDNQYSPHDLALILIIFAIGSLTSALHTDFSSEADHLHQMSRSAISLQSIFEKPSLSTVQCVHLLSFYNAISRNVTETSMETTWSFTRLAAQLAHSIGLHRDSERWGLPGVVVQRRRTFFWDLYMTDIWQSLHTGRPPSFDLKYADCKLPDVNADNEFAVWQYRFASDCVAQVTRSSLAAESPNYSAIMELDELVRQYPLPNASKESEVAASWQQFILNHIRETVLMYVHRNYFAQAFIDHPINPLKSPYAVSVLATYRSSSTILKCIRDQFAQWSSACGRFWPMWTFAFSAAVVFSTVVISGPRSPLANSAMVELKEACILFSNASRYSNYAKRALPILAKLTEKAHRALTTREEDESLNQLPWKMDADNDDILIFGGHTWFLSKCFDKQIINHAEPEIQLSSLSSSDHKDEYGSITLHSFTYRQEGVDEYTTSPDDKPCDALDTVSYTQHTRTEPSSEILNPKPSYISPYVGNIHSSTIAGASQPIPSDLKLDQWYAFLRSSDVEAHLDLSFQMGP